MWGVGRPLTRGVPPQTPTPRSPPYPSSLLLSDGSRPAPPYAIPGSAPRDHGAHSRAPHGAADGPRRYVAPVPGIGVSVVVWVWVWEQGSCRRSLWAAKDAERAFLRWTVARAAKRHASSKAVSRSTASLAKACLRCRPPCRRLASAAWTWRCCFRWIALASCRARRVWPRQTMSRIAVFPLARRSKICFSCRSPLPLLASAAFASRSHCNFANSCALTSSCFLLRQ